MFTPDRIANGASKKGAEKAGNNNSLSEQGTLDRIQKTLRFTWIILLGAAIYVGYILYSRRQEYSQLERQQAEIRTEKQRAEDEQTVQQLGGKQFEILNLVCFSSQHSTGRNGASLLWCFQRENRGPAASAGTGMAVVEPLRPGGSTENYHLYFNGGRFRGK